MKKHTLMLLGAGVMQLPAIRLGRRNNITVIAMDGNPDAVGAKEADIFENVDLKDIDALTERAVHYRGLGMLDGVFTAGTDFSVSVAAVAERVGLPGIPLETAMNATDKSRMREKFLTHNVPSPRFFSREKNDLDRLDSNSLRYPLVVKPVDNMGSRGVVKVHDQNSLRKAALQAVAYSRSGKVIIEEYIEGPEYSIDALVYQGKVILCGIAERHIYFPPFFVELGHTMPAELSEKNRKDLENVFIAGVHALGIQNGAAKGDVLLSKNGPVIGEIAARLSGGYMSGWTFPYSSGVEATLGAMRIALGLPPGDLTHTKNWTSAERAFISIPGDVEKLYNVDEARRIPGVQDVFLRVQKGDKVRFPENNVEKCGNVISALPGNAEACGAAEKSVSMIFLRLAPGVSETRDYLFSRNSESPHRAFILSQETQTNLNKIPWYSGREDGIKPLVFGSFSILPCKMEETRSCWGYYTAAQGLEVLERNGFLTSRPAWSDELWLGRVFWHAYFRGGHQGGLWVLDTLGKIKEKRNVEEMLCAWADLCLE